MDHFKHSSWQCLSTDMSGCTYTTQYNSTLDNCQNHTSTLQSFTPTTQTTCKCIEGERRPDVTTHFVQSTASQLHLSAKAMNARHIQLAPVPACCTRAHQDSWRCCMPYRGSGVVQTKTGGPGEQGPLSPWKGQAQAPGHSSMERPAQPLQPPRLCLGLDASRGVAGSIPLDLCRWSHRACSMQWQEPAAV
jgi:hypothetical protein